MYWFVVASVPRPPSITGTIKQSYYFSYPTISVSCLLRHSLHFIVKGSPTRHYTVNSATALRWAYTVCIQTAKACTKCILQDMVVYLVVQLTRSSLQSGLEPTPFTAVPFSDTWGTVLNYIFEALNSASLPDRLL